MVIMVYESVCYLSGIIIVKNPGPDSPENKVYLKQFCNLISTRITWRVCELQLAGLHLQCLIHRSGWGPRICISNMFQVMLMLQMQETTIDKH